jgi:hypothetical protein
MAYNDLNNPIATFTHFLSKRTLTMDGRKSTGCMLPIGTSPTSLRIIYTYQSEGVNLPPLSPDTLTEMRAFTGSRIVYSLTTASVAGAVSSTKPSDYRSEAGKKYNHFGPPRPSVEIRLADVEDLDNEVYSGSLVLTGPAVVGGKTKLEGTKFLMRGDGCLAYA